METADGEEVTEPTGRSKQVMMVRYHFHIIVITFYSLFVIAEIALLD